MPNTPRFRRAEQKYPRLLNTGRVVIASIALSAMTACASSFFKITPEDGSEPAPKPAAAKPEPKPAEKKPEKPAAKPAEKPREETRPPVVKPPETAAEKPIEKPRVQPKSEPAKADVPPRPPVAPPVARRPEPVITEPPAVEPAPAGSDSAGIARLMRAAALWDAVRLFHPAAVANPHAWDNATVRRLTDIRTAKEPGQYQQVLQRWIGALNDPIDRVRSTLAGEDNASGVGGNRDVTVQTQVAVTGSKKTRVEDTTVVVTWPRSTRTLADIEGWRNLRDVVVRNADASQLVIDLRASQIASREPRRDTALFAIQREVASLLTPVTVVGPSIRTRAYDGWPDERTTASANGARAYWRTSEPIVVVNGQASPRARRVVFVADANTEMPAALMALVSNKQAVLVSDSSLSDRLYAPRTTLAMGDNLEVTLRTGELVNADGSIGVQPDTIVERATSAADSAPVLRTAIRVARGQLQLGSATARKLADATYFDGTKQSSGAAAWNSAHYPAMGARLLALFKSWATLRDFHAYNDLRDENIDDALYRILPRVEAATDAYSYASAMLDFASSATDAQVRLSSPTLEQHIGAASAPFAVRWIEGRAIVTYVAPTDAGRASGLVVGDEISAADGFPMSAYVNERRRHGAASNDWTRLRNTMGMVPRGSAGAAVYRVREAGTRERTVNIERAAANITTMPVNERASAAVARELGSGFGYIDLTRATVTDVEKVFGDMAATRALIIDARGAVAASGQSLPAALALTLQRTALQARTVVGKQTLRAASRPCAPAEMQTTTSLCVAERQQFDDVIAADTTRRYRGRVVVLIDERTEGAMEQFAMAMESASNATLVGTPTAGATGAVTAVQVPGVMTLTFSATEVRRPDGGQLQRVGLTPVVDALPTVKGIRAGTDDVLERAQQWLREQLDPQPARRRR